MGDVVPINRPRVVPGGVDVHPVATVLLCGIIASVFVVPWWIGLWTIVGWLLR